MKLNPLLGAAALATASLSAHAVGPGALGAIDNTPIVVSNVVPGGLLFDVYTFTLLGTSDLSGFAGTIEAPPALSISNFSVVLQDAGFNVVGADASPADGFSFSGLAAGSYALSFFGLSTGVLGGAYAGAIYAASAVPEPDRYAMLLAGLAAIGFVLVRRSKSD